MYVYKREPLVKDEVTRLEHACQTVQEKLVVWVLLDTGLRVAELVSLTPQSLDWQARCLIVHGKGGPFGKMSKRRIVPLSERAYTLLSHHFSLQATVGMSKRTAQYVVKRVANRAQIARPVSAHVLRHTFAVTALRKGISLPILQRILGHDHLATTQVYLNLSAHDVLCEFEAKW